MVLGANRLGYVGRNTRVENRGETTRGETTRGETSWGRSVLLPYTGGFERKKSESVQKLPGVFVCRLKINLVLSCLDPLVLYRKPTHKGVQLDTFFDLLLRRSISDQYLRSCGYVTCSRPQ